MKESICIVASGQKTKINVRDLIKEHHETKLVLVEPEKEYKEIKEAINLNMLQNSGQRIDVFSIVCNEE